MCVCVCEREREREREGWKEEWREKEETLREREGIHDQSFTPTYPSTFIAE